MMLRIPALLSPEQVLACRSALDECDWNDGRLTAGYQSARAKRNHQLPEHSPVAQTLGEVVQNALANHALFFSAALPLKVFPPLFNRYADGQAFGAHIDNAIRLLKGSDFRLRTDLSATLFLSEPDSYAGGELIIEERFDLQTVKLAAGDLVLYPASTLHRVAPVTRGVRLAAVFWIQSMVRDESARRMLFELDESIQMLTADEPDDSTITLRLTGLYHNLLRRWADS